MRSMASCFKEQRYKLFESNSQLFHLVFPEKWVVSKSKDTSYLKAIHNRPVMIIMLLLVVSKSKDTSYLKAIHNSPKTTKQLSIVVSKSKDTSYLKAIHNQEPASGRKYRLFQRAKIQVI